MNFLLIILGLIILFLVFKYLIKKKLGWKKYSIKDLEISKNVEKKVILPGFVLLKGVLDRKCQKIMYEFAQKIGSGKIGTKNSFWVDYKGKKVLNLTTRGRIYNCLTNYDDGKDIVKFCQKLVNEAQSVDKKMPDCFPTHMISLLYKGTAGISNNKLLTKKLF